MRNLILVMLLCCITKLEAQQNTVASGGNATGTGGNVSYSIGQVADKMQTGTNGNITQGVQQPYEIVTLSGSEYENIRMEAIVYPNPAITNVTLKISNSDWNNVNYQLFDIQGKLINDGKVLNEETVFDMKTYTSAIYILKINSNTKELKTFKIIKN